MQAQLVLVLGKANLKINLHVIPICFFLIFNPADYKQIHDIFIMKVW